MENFPTKNQLVQNFLSCSSWEEKYMYMIDLGNLLPKFPKKFRTTEYLVTGCQSYTWIALDLIKNIVSTDDKDQNIIKFYGDSNSAIVKGIIVIIFSIYKNMDIKSITSFNINAVFDQLQLTQNITTYRSQGTYSILNSIYVQIHKLMLNN